jgi:hypothetical protein
MMAHVKNIFGGHIRNKECPKALGVYSPSDLVSFDLYCSSDLSFWECTSWF